MAYRLVSAGQYILALLSLPGTCPELPKAALILMAYNQGAKKME